MIWPQYDIKNIQYDNLSKYALFARNNDLNEPREEKNTTQTH